MKCLVKKTASEGLNLAEAEVPRIEPNEVLIKVTKTSICGTDTHIYKWDDWARKTVPIPLIIGHEFAGIVEEIGSQVQSIPIGARVSGESHITCGKCSNCLMGRRHLCPLTEVIGIHRQGCFAEYLALPEENVFLLPESVPDEIASIFDPFGNAVHTAFSTNLTGEDILITGAGPIGVTACAIAKMAGARHVVVTDINPYRLELAKKMGATTAINTSSVSLEPIVQDLGLTEGFTVGLEMSGNVKALDEMLNVLKPGSFVGLLGLLPSDAQIDCHKIIFKMITLKGIYGREIFKSWFEMCRLLDGGLDLKPLITHRLSYEDFDQGFQAMISGESGKVVLDWCN